MINDYGDITRALQMTPSANAALSRKFTVYGASLAGSVTPERASGSVKPTHGDRKSTQAVKSRAGHARKQLSSSRASGVQQTPTDGHTAAIRTGSSTAKMKMKSKNASEVPAQSEVTPSQITPTHSRLLDAMPRAHDILAAQVLYIVYTQCTSHVHAGANFSNFFNNR